MPEDSRSAAAAPVAPAAGGDRRAPPPRNPLPFLLFVVVLCVAGWLLVSWMADSTRIQDCVGSGRKNCAPLDPGTGR